MRLQLIIVLLLLAVPLSAQERSNKSDLSMTLRAIAAERTVASSVTMGDLVAKGLSGDSDEKEAALWAIGSRSGILMTQNKENLAIRESLRPTLLAFKPQVQKILAGDPDKFVREAAVLALAGLSMEIENGALVVTLDDQEVTFLNSAFHAESFAGARADIVKLVAQCAKCATSNLEARKQLIRAAVYDAAPAVVEQALYGAGDLKLADALDYIATLLNSEDIVTRVTAAKAIQRYGADGVRHHGALRDALARETSPDVRGVMESALNGNQ